MCLSFYGKKLNGFFGQPNILTLFYFNVNVTLTTHINKITAIWKNKSMSLSTNHPFYVSFTYLPNPLIALICFQNFLNVHSMRSTSAGFGRTE